MKTKSILIFSSASIASLFGTQLGAALLPVDLGTSADYVVLAKTAIPLPAEPLLLETAASVQTL